MRSQGSEKATLRESQKFKKMKIRRKKTAQKPPKINKKLIILAFFILFVLSLFAKLITGLSEEYFSIADFDEDGNVALTLYDLPAEKVVKIVIPGDTYAHLAMGRGKLRLRSVKRLMETENLPDQFIVDTVMKTLLLPVDYSAGDVPLMVKANILFASLRGLSEEEINLAETHFLRKEKLPDGEEGYIVGNITIGLASLFADPVVAEGAKAVRVVNKTGDSEHKIREVLAILEVLGVKPVPPVNDQPSSQDCIVSARNERILDRMARVFNCAKSTKEPEAFDIELVLGKAFLERF